MFHVVEFTAHLPKERMVVPDIWLSINDTLCVLPPLATDREMEELVKNRAEPDVGWQMYGVHSLQTFDSYSEARNHLEKVREASPSDDGPRRKRKKPNYLSNYTSVDSDDDHPETSNSQQNFSAAIKEEIDEPEESSDIEWFQPDLVITSVTSGKKSSSGTISKTPRLQASSKNTAVNAKCACNSTCHKTILELLLSIQKQIEKNTRMLQQLLGYKAPPLTTLQSLPKTFPVSLPISEIEGLEEMDSFFLDSTNFAQTVSYFAALGGNDFKQTLRRILDKMISAELAQQLNWRGRGEKKPFQTFVRIHNVIYHAAKQNPKCEGITLTDVEKFIKDWLRFAPDRYGGRLKRRLEALEKVASKDLADSGT